MLKPNTARRTIALGALALVFLGCEAEPTVQVFAAASLHDALSEASRTYEEDHPEIQVRVSSAGSQVLRRQIEAGARADIFVPASREHVEPLAAELDPAHPIVCNSVVAVVPDDSPIRHLEELPRVERLVVGTPEVPIGAYAEELITRGGRAYGEVWRRHVLARITSRELDARQVLAKVALGEADAAIVYASDALHTEGVRALEHRGVTVQSSYPGATLRRAGPAASRFLEWLHGPDGQRIFEAHGFENCEVAHGSSRRQTPPDGDGTTTAFTTGL